jgi:ABC-type microcin C transport system permease subunit YejE
MILPPQGRYNPGMKSLLIIVLLFALAAAAFFTKPGKDDFQSFIVQEQTKNETNVLKKAIDEEMAKQTASHFTYKNRFLWEDVQQDGVTVYTGAFSHWFNRAQINNEMQKVEHKSQDALTKASEKMQKQ